MTIIKFDRAHGSVSLDSRGIGDLHVLRAHVVYGLHRRLRGCRLPVGDLLCDLCRLETLLLLVVVAFHRALGSRVAAAALRRFSGDFLRRLLTVTISVPAALPLLLVA